MEYPNIDKIIENELKKMQINYPSVKDFRKYGRFYQVEYFDVNTKIPTEILFYSFPDYFINRRKPSSKILDNLKNHCIEARKQALYEDQMQDLNDQKELQIRRLEEKFQQKYGITFTSH